MSCKTSRNRWITASQAAAVVNNFRRLRIAGFRFPTRAGEAPQSQLLMLILMLAIYWWDDWLNTEHFRPDERDIFKSIARDSRKQGLRLGKLGAIIQSSKISCRQCLNKNSSGDEIANVRLFTTTSYM